MKLLLEKARELGPIAAYRVMTLESNSAIRHVDFDTLEAALVYARDAEMEVAWNDDESSPIALVVDRDFNPVDERRR